MASRSKLPSDPTFLLEYMEELPNESGSEDEFDGYLGPEDGTCVFQSDGAVDDSTSEQFANATGEPTAHMESPLASLSPSPSRMEGHYLRGSLKCKTLGVYNV